MRCNSKSVQQQYSSGLVATTKVVVLHQKMSNDAVQWFARGGDYLSLLINLWAVMNMSYQRVKCSQHELNLFNIACQRIACIKKRIGCKM